MPRKTTAPAPRKPVDARSITSDDIAAHLAAFTAAGGEVEVLGVTRVLKHVGDAATPTAPAPTR
jgi:hypothetical protein